MKGIFSIKRTVVALEMMMVIFLFGGMISCTSNNNQQAQQAALTPKRTLLALSKADHILAIIDAATLKVIARVPVGPDPHEVIASSDGKTAYVSIMGNGDSHEIDVIDLVGQKRLPDIDTRPLYGPHGITFVGGKVWFTAQDSKAVGRYNTTDAKLDWCMGTGQDRTHMIYVTADEKKVYATNVRAGTVSILENELMKPMMPPGGHPPNGGGLGQGPGPGGPGGQGPKAHWDWVETIVPVHKGSEGFDVSPDGRWIWTAASDDGIISIIDTSSRTVTDTIDAKVQGANRLKFTPDGKYVFVSSLRSGNLSIFDVATRKLIKQLNIGHGGAGILMDPDGTRALVACTPDNYIAVVDLKRLEVTGHLDIGGPDGMAWAVQP